MLISKAGILSENNICLKLYDNVHSIYFKLAQDSCYRTDIVEKKTMHIHTEMSFFFIEEASLN